MAELKYFYGLGRRKSATAQVRLTAGKGKMTINDKPAATYFSENKTQLAEITDPSTRISLAFFAFQPELSFIGSCWAIP